MNVRLQYEKRARRFEQEAASLSARYNRFSMLRLVGFILGIAAVIYGWSTFGVLVGLFLLFLIGLAFAWFVRWHQKMQHLRRHLEKLATINQLELQAADNDFSSFDPGLEFIDPAHPYTGDLDIFGEFSFFQYTDRTSTASGKQWLADYLQTPAEKTKILLRQEAITELSEKLDWRQDFQATGQETNDSPVHVKQLKEWLKTEPFVKGNRMMTAALFLAPIWALIGLLLFIFYLPWYAAILFLVPPAWLLRRTYEQVNQVHLRTTHAEDVLSRYSDLMRCIETEDFTSKKLQKIKAALFSNSEPASRNIRRLSYLIGQLNVRYNVFAVFLNLGGLWDLQWVYRLEKWKEKMKSDVPVWFDALAELEAILSFATLHFNNPDWIFPEIYDEDKLVAEAIGHPLIAAETRVDNDMKMPVRGHIRLITGSNMAGKSTFLRTAGLNIVLAMTGAPVCAKKFQVPLLRVYTSMRTQDALHESTSAFYAELKRLKFVIEAVERGEKVFFILDEILKGTNSRDRHTGAKALIEQLIRSKGAGLIATHDLELGALEKDSEGAIENWCLEVDIRGDQLHFDYKLKPGISKSFNATLLMQQMGIRV